MTEQKSNSLPLKLGYSTPVLRHIVSPAFGLWNVHSCLLASWDYGSGWVMRLVLLYLQPLGSGWATSLAYQITEGISWNVSSLITTQANYPNKTHFWDSWVCIPLVPFLWRTLAIRVLFVMCPTHFEPFHTTWHSWFWSTLMVLIYD